MSLSHPKDRVEEGGMCREGPERKLPFACVHLAQNLVFTLAFCSFCHHPSTFTIPLYRECKSF
jgi:hypothetical protein